MKIKTMNQNNDAIFHNAFIGAVAILSVVFIGTIVHEELGNQGLVLYGLFLAGGIGSILIHGAAKEDKDEEEIERAQ